MTTTAETDHHAPKQKKALEERTIGQAKEKAKELLKFYMELFGRHDRQVTDVPQESVAWKHSKEAATHACQLKREGEPVWAYNNWFYEEVIEQINKL